MIISLINKSTVVSDAQVKAVIPALNIQLSDFCGAWKISKPSVRFGPVTDSVPVYVFDDSDQQGALGYHDVSPDWKPYARVFAKSDAEYGLNWTVTLSHEVLELVADPWANATVQIGNSTFVALEVCDPVEADSMAQVINGVALSNWVYPRWFDGTSKQGPWDRMGKLSGPLKLAPGGYIGIWTPAKGWAQKTAHAVPDVVSRAGGAHRIAARVGGEFEITD